MHVYFQFSGLVILYKKKTESHIFLTYLIFRLCRYHGMHHIHKRSNFCLFMPLFDALGNTIDERYWNLHRETSSSAGGNQPDSLRPTVHS